MSNGQFPAPVGNNASSSSKSGGKSCFLIGCIGLAVLTLVATILLGVGIGFLFKKGKAYTAENPVELAAYETEDGECDALQARFSAFERDGGTLALSADDLNAAIVCHPDWEILKGKAWVKIEDGQLVVDGSFPMNEIPGFRDRYFNGALSLNVHKQAGDLQIHVTDVKIEGQAIPRMFIDKLSGQNMASELKDNAELEKFMKQMKSIEVKGDQLILMK